MIEAKLAAFPPSLEQLELLHQQLPALMFNPATDTVSSELPIAKNYLDYYRLNPEEFALDVKHYLGMSRVQLDGGVVFQIACHYWITSEAKGTAFIVHGYFDHVGLYGHLIRELLQRNMNVVAFDLPGHGISDGERATVKSFDSYVAVFESICLSAAEILPRPWQVIGQSTGGAIVLKHLLEEERWQAELADKTFTFDDITLLAPLVYPRFWAFNRLVYRFAHRFIKRIKRSFVANSGDLSFVEFIKSGDPLQSRYLPLEWVGAMKRWTEELEQLPVCKRPVKIIQGDRDSTLDWEDNLVSLREKLPLAKVYMVQGAQHHLVNETEALRKTVFDLIDS